MCFTSKSSDVLVFMDVVVAEDKTCCFLSRFIKHWLQHRVCEWSWWDQMQDSVSWYLNISEKYLQICAGRFWTLNKEKYCSDHLCVILFESCKSGEYWSFSAFKELRPLLYVVHCRYDDNKTYENMMKPIMTASLKWLNLILKFKQSTNQKSDVDCSLPKVSLMI